MASAPAQSLERHGLRLKDLPDWPSCLDLTEAGAYTGLSQAELQKASRMGQLTWRAVGAKGRHVVQRAQLDALVRSLFTGNAPLEDLDFGAD